MKIIIAGDGKVGLALTRQLLHEGHEVTIVDSNPGVLQANMYQYDVLAVQGNAATMEALRQAQVQLQPSHSQLQGRLAAGRQEASGSTGTMPLSVPTSSSSCSC